MPYILSQPVAGEKLRALNRILRDVQVRSGEVLGNATSTINDAINFAEFLDGKDQLLSAEIASIDNDALINVARSEYNRPGYDPVTEFSTARTAMNALADFIDTNIPRDGTANRIELATWSLAVGKVYTQLTAAQRSALNAQITSFLANFE